MNKVPSRWRSMVVLLLVGAAAISTSVTGQTGGLTAQVLTNEGKTLRGELGGIRSPIRLDVSAFAPSIGPDQAYDIPLAAVRQITIDFARVVVETADRVFIGPLSAFRGIADGLTLRHGSQTFDLPIASLRAIALNGETLHPVPHEWLGDGFLVVPTVFPVPTVPMKPHRESGLVPPFGTSALTAATTHSALASSAIQPAATLSPEPAVASTGALPASYADLYPMPPVETQAETPWWVGVLVLAAALGLLYFLTTSASGS